MTATPAHRREDDRPTGASTTRRPGGRRRRPLLVAVGSVAVIGGLVLLLIAAYHVWGVSAEVRREQERLTTELEQIWAATDPGPAAIDEPVIVDEPVTAALAERIEAVGSDDVPDPVVRSEPTVGRDSAPNPTPTGRPIVRMYIPRLGLSWAVVEGVTTRALRSGPGHYPMTQLPGERGNFAVAGHRVPGVFWDLDKLAPGDPIVVRTAEEWLVYQVSTSLVVDPHEVWVIEPDPYDIGAAPTRSLLTVTTCTPKGSNAQRLVVHAELTSRSPATDPPPVRLS